MFFYYRGEETTILVTYDSDSELEYMEEVGMVNPATQKSIESLEVVRIEEATLCSICRGDFIKWKIRTRRRKSSSNS